MMSDPLENEAIAEALAVIDQSLERVHERGMLTSSEVSDLLLDVRLLLARRAVGSAPAPAATGGAGGPNRMRRPRECVGGPLALALRRRGITRHIHLERPRVGRALGDVFR